MKEVQNFDVRVDADIKNLYANVINSRSDILNNLHAVKKVDTWIGDCVRIINGNNRLLYPSEIISTSNSGGPTIFCPTGDIYGPLNPLEMQSIHLEQNARHVEIDTVKVPAANTIDYFRFLVPGKARISGRLRYVTTWAPSLDIMSFAFNRMKDQATLERQVEGTLQFEFNNVDTNYTRDMIITETYFDVEAKDIIWPCWAASNLDKFGYGGQYNNLVVNLEFFPDVPLGDLSALPAN